MPPVKSPRVSWPYHALAADVPSGPQGRKNALSETCGPDARHGGATDNLIEVKLFGSRKYGDAVAPEGPYPKVIADRDCHGARCEGFGIRLIDELCYLQCFGIDPYHVCRLLSLACCQNGSIRSKSDVVYAKTQWNRIPLYRSLTARQP